MWRRTFLSAVVLVSVHSAQAQVESPPPPRLVPEVPTRSLPPSRLGFPTQPTAQGRLPNGIMPTQASGPGLPTLPSSAALPAGPALPVVPMSPPYINPPMGGVIPESPPLLPVENLVTFNTDIAELQWRDNRWQLWAGNHMLKDFGRYETEGREALRLVRDLRLNALGSIGSPRPIMEYWLSNGEAPRGPVQGLRTLTMDTSTLRAEQVQGQWVLRDGQRILFNFGTNGDLARQALQTVQRHGFTQVGHVGQLSPVMLVFLANPTLMPTSAVQGPERTRETRFPRLASLGTQRTVAQGLSPTDPRQPQQPSPAPPVLMPSPTGLQRPGAITPVGLSMLNPSNAPGMQPPLVAAQGEHIPIDARQLQVRRDEGDWMLYAGTHPLAKFGPNEADARLAQAALRYYHCTEQVHIGSPRVAFSYFLTNGQAPRGAMLGLHPMQFRGDQLSLRQLGNSVVLWDGSQIVMSFGDRMPEAQQVLQAIQQHRFDGLVRIGHGDKGMTLLVRAR